MPIYVALGKATDQGSQVLGNLSNRHSRARERVEAVGGKLLASYALMGQYDYLAIADFPDERVAMQFMVKEAKRGHVKYETMNALPMDEFAKLVEE